MWCFENNYGKGTAELFAEALVSAWQMFLATDQPVDIYDPEGRFVGNVGFFPADD